MKFPTQTSPISATLFTRPGVFTVICGIALLLVSAVGAAEKQMYAKRYLNQKAPALVVEKWVTSAPDYKGKFMLIDFWATWCPPCKKAIPELNKIQQTFSDKLVVIGLSKEEEATVRGLTSPKINYYLAVDRAGRTQTEAQVEAIPHAILIDPKGIVRWEGLPLQPGYELTEQVVREILEKYGK